MVAILARRTAWHATLIGIAALALATVLNAAAAAPAEDGADQITATALPDTDSYAYVPGEMDLMRASRAQLAQYGFPPRPDPKRAVAYQAWRDAVLDMQRLVPVLQPVDIHHGPIRRTRTARGIQGAAGASDAGPDNTAATSSNWSGYVAAAPAFAYGPQSMTSVFGDWILPVAQPAFNACRKQPNGAEVYSSTWVGIDGNGSGDVLQAGTESDAVCSLGEVGPYQGAWYEWYPFNEVRITNLPVTPGAAMYVHVWASNATTGHAYFANRTTHQAVSIRFSAPPGIRLIGNSAEWVLERPMVNGALATLTNYVQEFFANAQAFDAQHNAYYPGTSQTIDQPPALAIQMTDDADQVISVPTLLGENAIWFADQGSAKHIPRS